MKSTSRILAVLALALAGSLAAASPAAAFIDLGDVLLTNDGVLGLVDISELLGSG